jgi:hypothetical protein
MLCVPAKASNDEGTVTEIWLAVFVNGTRELTEQAVPSQQTDGMVEIGKLLSGLVRVTTVSAWPATAVLGVIAPRVIGPTCPLASAAEKHRRARII